VPAFSVYSPIAANLSYSESHESLTDHASSCILPAFRMVQYDIGFEVTVCVFGGW
jgi:hypothetical protein